MFVYLFIFLSFNFFSQENITLCLYIHLFCLANPEEVIQCIKEAGFKIQFEKEVTLTKDLASQFYHEHEGKDFYEGLTDYMSRYVHRNCCQ